MATICSRVLQARGYLCSSLKERRVEIAAKGNRALCGTRLPQHGGANAAAAGSDRFSERLDADAESRHETERTFVLNSSRTISAKRCAECVDGTSTGSRRFDRDTTVCQVGRR